MPTPYPAALIRHERLQRNWSQEGLCAGICTVSYLSKIEQGKAEPSPSVLKALLARLDVCWHDGPDAQQANVLADRWEQALVAMDSEAVHSARQSLNKRRKQLLHGPSMLRLLLLESLSMEDEPSHARQLAAFESCFDERQRAMWLMLCNRWEEALALWPVGYAWLNAGAAAYRQGAYTQAIEQLLHACSLAAEEGHARVLLHARTLLGNCYSDLNDHESMMKHYRPAQRLARDLREDALLRTISYNTACTEIQLGRCEEALAKLRAIDHPDAMTLHKIAICCERLCDTQQALEALDGAAAAPVGWPGREWADEMCALVRMRLSDPAYLRSAAYGRRLTDCFDRMTRELAAGYACFHLPWVEEWYAANRMYKQAYELRKRFS